MTKTIEYRVIPVDRWIVCRFEREDNGNLQSGSSVQRGEFPNEEMANEIAAMLAKADDEGAVFVSRASMNCPASQQITRPLRG